MSPCSNRIRMARNLDLNPEFATIRILRRWNTKVTRSVGERRRQIGGHRLQTGPAATAAITAEQPAEGQPLSAPGTAREAALPRWKQRTMPTTTPMRNCPLPV